MDFGWPHLPDPSIHATDPCQAAMGMTLKFIFLLPGLVVLTNTTTLSTTAESRRACWCFRSSLHSRSTAWRSRIRRQQHHPPPREGGAGRRRATVVSSGGGLCRGSSSSSSMSRVGEEEEEEHLRREATYALLPVFFPATTPPSFESSSRDDDGMDGGDPAEGRRRLASPTTTITAEASLKRLLRENYQHPPPRQKGCVVVPDDDRGNCRNPRPPPPVGNESRGRLAELILGTSVMRLRHWYVVAAAMMIGRKKEGIIISSRSNNGGAATKLPIPHPLPPSLLSLVTTIHNNNASDGDDDPPLDVLSEAENHHNHYSIEETTLFVRAMVDEHANYLSSSSSSGSNRTLSFPNIPSSHHYLRLSIRYSLPTFLASSLLSQYGEARAEEICETMNIPGPVTLRRNAIRFPGSDADLCEWLRDEDGIEAICCNRLQHHHQLRRRQNDNDDSSSEFLPMTVGSTTSSRDGGNRYVVGSSTSSVSINSIPPPDGAIRIITPESSIDNATTTAVRRRRGTKSIWSMKGWQNGYFEVQDAGSQIITQSLEAKPGESILDYCAGNGGKTFGLASALLDTASRNYIGNSSSSRHDDDNYCDEEKSRPTSARRGKIVAHDVIDERLRQIRGSMKRVGFSARVDEGNDDNETFYVAKNSHGDGECSIRIATSSDFTASSFDAVLVDAPCSSTGVLRRRPSQRWDLAESDIYEGLPILQLEILVKAASFVREGGGRLVYSTCSLLEEENECVARKFEQSPAGRSFERWDFFPTTTTGCWDSLAGEDDEQSLRHTLSLLPSADGSDGFFIARWKKIGGTKI